MDKSPDLEPDKTNYNVLTRDESDVALRLIVQLEKFFSFANIRKDIDPQHLSGTPYRIVKSMIEMFHGCWEDPDEALNTLFSNTKYDEIIYENDISFASNCAHHNLAFFGKMHFGYLPDKSIVGLSKIPRLIRVYSKRPQVQELLTQQIVDKFMAIVEPQGCGLVVEAYHLCMLIRGIEAIPTYTKTTALRGTFKSNESTKQEFLQGIKKTTGVIWP